MLDEPIDLLVHEVEQDLAAVVREDLLDERERDAGPSKGIDERERRRQRLARFAKRVEQVVPEAVLKVPSCRDPHLERCWSLDGVDARLKSRRALPVLLDEQEPQFGADLRLVDQRGL